MGNTIAIPDKPFIDPVLLKQLYGNNTVLQALSNQGSLNIKVHKYYTDVNGQVIAKTSAPAALQTKFPVFLLGNFDRVGAYNIGQKIMGLAPGVFFLCTYVHGVDPPFLWNTGFNNIASNFKFGDIITVFTDDLNNPTTFVFIRQTCEYGGLASIISNTQTQQKDGRIGIMFCSKIKLQIDQQQQLTEIWQIIELDNLGNFIQNNLSPLQYKTPYWTLNEFLELPLSFIMTQFVAIDFNMQFASDELQVNLIINK